MYYHHQFQVAAPLARVAEFHRRSASLAAITPPPIVVQVQRAPQLLEAGDELEFTLWFGPLPVRWLARIEALSAGGFSDRQVRGPFAGWMHRHSFLAVDENTTRVVDEISLKLRAHPGWGALGLGMWLGLPLLFAFRAWKTRKILSA